CSTPPRNPLQTAHTGDDEKKLIAEAVLGMGGEGSPPGEGASPPPDSSGDHGIAASVARAAFLGPTIWDRTIPYGGNAFTLEYMDLDDFLSQEELTLSPETRRRRGASLERNWFRDGPTARHQENPKYKKPKPPWPSQMMAQRSGALSSGWNVEQPNSVNTRHNSSSLPRHPPPSPSPPSDDEVEVEFVPSPTDVALSTVPGQEPFDPRRRRFSPDELKPQPIVKKARKVYVPDDCK
uniref:TEF transcription factor, PAR bZIP family member a n=1 Tax=Petromyzon marinus TaxID=7757 RepID=S4S082_PETMA